MRTLQARTLTLTRMCLTGLHDCNAVCLSASLLPDFYRSFSLHQTGVVMGRTLSCDDIGKRQAGGSFSLLSLQAV